MGSFGGFFGNNFRCLSWIFATVLVLVLLEGRDASRDGRIKIGKNEIKFPQFEVYEIPAIQWACEPFLESKHENIEQNRNRRNIHHLKEKTRELCMKLRGGRLGEGTENSEIVVDGSSGEGSIESNMSIVDESSITILEKEKKSNTEVDTIEVDSSSAEGINVDLPDVPAAETDGSVAQDVVGQDTPSEEQLYAPSAAPTVSKKNSKKSYTFTVFQEGDGHETDPDGIPTRYLKMQNDRRDLAKTALEKTVKWRKENDIDTILARPHPKFDVSKAVFPHYFCGRDDTQHVILLQRPGLMNVKLAHKNNLTGEELLFHYIYVMEYLWRIIDPAPDATMTSIIDLTEMNISILRKREQLRIGSLFLSTMDAHFPQRSHRTFLINAPKWFGALYKLASPLLRESTKEKIQILSKGKEQDEVLRNLLRDCPIPEGEKYENVPAGVMEEELRDFCLARLEESGVTMQPVEPV